MKKSTDIVLLNENSLMRDMLRCMLECLDVLPRPAVLGEADNGATALQMLAQHRPRLLMTGLTLPDIDVFALVEYIAKNFPETAVVAITEQSEVSGLLPFLAAGGRGYLNKFVSDADLGAAIGCVLGGEIFVSPGGVQLVLADYRVQAMLARAGVDDRPDAAVRAVYSGQNARDMEQVSILSERERAVLHHYVHGYTIKETAMLLFLAESTVITYLKRIKEKLNLNKRSELLQYAMTHNLFHASP